MTDDRRVIACDSVAVLIGNNCRKLSAKRNSGQGLVKIRPRKIPKMTGGFFCWARQKEFGVIYDLGDCRRLKSLQHIVFLCEVVPFLLRKCISMS